MGQRSSATHLGEANTSANVIMAKTGHKSLLSTQRYVQPGLAAVHTAHRDAVQPTTSGIGENHRRSAVYPPKIPRVLRRPQSGGSMFIIMFKQVDNERKCGGFPDQRKPTAPGRLSG
jgi:hypothetical protein